MRGAVLCLLCSPRLRRVGSVLLVALGLASPTWARESESLRHALAAQALLGATLWSEVVKIENRNPGPVYSETVYALVFELADILWFYCDHNGTQSLSQYIGATARERQNLGRLFRIIEPGFETWAVVPDRVESADFDLPNACFLRSVAAWQEIGAAGTGPDSALLLLFYADTPRGREGHTVLAFAEKGRWQVLDSEEPVAQARFTQDVERYPLAVARALGGSGVTRARTLPLPAWPHPDRVVEGAGNHASGRSGPRRQNG